MFGCKQLSSTETEREGEGQGRRGGMEEEDDEEGFHTHGKDAHPSSGI